MSATFIIDSRTEEEILRGIIAFCQVQLGQSDNHSVSLVAFGEREASALGEREASALGEREAANAAAIERMPDFGISPLPSVIPDDEIPNDPNAPPPPPIDVNGLAWDERIHASSKGVNQDGSWRLKRNVSKDLVAHVEAEQRGDNEPSAIPLPPGSSGDTPTMPGIPTPPLPPIVATTAPEPLAVAKPVTFPQFMLKVAELQKSGIFTQAELSGAVKEFGLGAVPDLIKNTGLIPSLVEYIDAIVAGKAQG